MGKEIREDCRKFGREAWENSRMIVREVREYCRKMGIEVKLDGVGPVDNRPSTN